MHMAVEYEYSMFIAPAM